jgi:hypothetical protein
MRRVREAMALAGRDQGRGHHRAVGDKVELRQPDGIDAQLFSRFHQGEGLLERLGLGPAAPDLELDEYAEVHGSPISA